MRKQISLGSLKNFHLYDDNSFPNGIDTDGPIRTSNPPVNSNDVIRNADVGSGGPVAPSDAEYLVLSFDGDLSNERRLVAGPGLKITDDGANSDATIETSNPVADGTYTFGGGATGDVASITVNGGIITAITLVP